MQRGYHLTSVEYALSNIALKRLKIARFGDLNDPFELLAAEIREYDYHHAIRSWKSTFHTKYGLLCFSRAWRNPVLWSHYATKHRGVCLGFDIADGLAEPVTYVAERIPIRFEGDDPANGLTEDFVRQLLCTKYQHWQYEEEMRVFVGFDRETLEGGAYFYPFSDELVLREVILGAACELPVERVTGFVREIYGDTVVVRKARLAFKWFEVVPDQRYEPKVV